MTLQAGKANCFERAKLGVWVSLGFQYKVSNMNANCQYWSILSTDSKIGQFFAIVVPKPTSIF